MRSGDAKHGGSSEYRHRKHTLRSQPFGAVSRSGPVNNLPSGRLFLRSGRKTFDTSARKTGAEIIVLQTRLNKNQTVRFVEQFVLGGQASADTVDASRS
ncbi:hypothetical protein M2444_005079 [Paenibacillus sp. PastF-3]|uniref:hypothetical protein n=1 Tax=Paenibacillus TaxID=44249 RepID=UPI0024770F62|nr:hypothetical protein [Paenibacillus sp. PastF-3]MDH6373249.1 hypothetical protein [Paenibacillus sp. PastF-3]